MLCPRSAKSASLRLTIGRYAFEKLQNAPQISLRQRKAWPITRRSASTQARATQTPPISSVTSVDALKSLPKGREELYDALTALKFRAASYVNLSQVELALRGVESEKAVIRIAILGVNGVASAAKLLRSILADPLKSEEPWENELFERAIKDGRGMLVRYGETYDYDAPNHLLQTLSIPATHLYQNEVEYLVLNFTPGGSSATSDRKLDDLLTPLVEIPNSASGRVSLIRHPAHKALVYAEGIQGLLAISGSLRIEGEGSSSGAIVGAVNNDWAKDELDAISKILSIQLESAESAIATLRQSVENSIEYEQLWLQSRVSRVTDWLEDGVNTKFSTLKPALTNLINILLESAEKRLATEASKELLQRQAKEVTYDVRQNLQKAVIYWAECSHNDLQYSLEMAFRGRYWAGLAWWKLPWHIDDVEMFLTHLVQKSWLVEPEKWMIYLGGRMNQAGIDVLAMNSGAEELRAKLLQFEHATVPNSIPNSSQPPIPPDSSEPPTPPSSSKSPTTLLPPRPHQISQWTQTISLSRTLLIQTHFAPLQATGQRLLWQAYSLTALTSTLASLMYVSVSTTSFYEAGAVAAFGLVYGARRLQARWEAERAKLKWALRQTGRSQIRRFEEEARQAIERDGIGEAVDVVAQDREEARKAIERVRKALRDMEKGEVRTE